MAQVKKKPRKYGWGPDVPDIRDHAWQPTMELSRLPAKIDLTTRANWPEPYNQGSLGACTAHAISRAMSYEQMKLDATVENHNVVPVSRLFIYYNERLKEGTVKIDNGAQIRTGVKSVVKEGACPETDWPYVQKRFTQKPPAKCYKTAAKHKMPAYERVHVRLEDIKAALAEDHPIMFGIMVYDSFSSDRVAKSGNVPMPKKNEPACGGHAMLMVGYDDKTQRVKFLNSWGGEWGKGGYGTLPYAYVSDTNLADDFWVFKQK